MVRVLFVCLGNICRSPTAEGVFRDLVAREGLASQVEADSAGTYAYHEGEAPDSRSQAEALGRGYDLSVLRARKVRRQDFEDFDYVLAMDASNLSDLQSQCPPDAKARVELFLTYARGTSLSEVPDPYSGGPQGFSKVLDLVEDACRGLLIEVRESLGHKALR